MLVVVSLGIAIRFALLGLWMVLPFTLLDLIAVVALVNLSRRRTAYVEKICIEGDSLKIFHLQKNNNRDWSFPLYWAKVNIVPPRHRWYPNRLLLGAYGEWVEVGQCLTDDERESLASGVKAEIRRALAPVHAMPPDCLQT